MQWVDWEGPRTASAINISPSVGQAGNVAWDDTRVVGTTKYERQSDMLFLRRSFIRHSVKKVGNEKTTRRVLQAVPATSGTMCFVLYSYSARQGGVGAGVAARVCVVRGPPHRR